MKSMNWEETNTNFSSQRPAGNSFWLAAACFLGYSPRKLGCVPHPEISHRQSTRTDLAVSQHNLDQSGLWVGFGLQASL